MGNISFKLVETRLENVHVIRIFCDRQIQLKILYNSFKNLNQTF